MLDYRIENAMIVDGTGKEAYKGSIGIRAGKIEINPVEESKKVIDADGLYLCPGFIDSHSHTDRFIGSEPETISLCKISQGITTEVTGQCGSSPFPVPRNRAEEMVGYFEADGVNPEQIEAMSEYETFSSFVQFAERQRLVGNFAFLQGHSTLRMAVMGYDDRKPTTAELEEMKRLLKQAMEAGCMGLSTGLIYVPGVYANTEEIIELCKVIKSYGGIYATHMRSESDHVIEAVKEAIQIAREADVPLVISHHKVCGLRNWGKSKETLELVEKAIEEGVKITLDQYPYIASSTGLCQCLHPKYFTKGNAEVVKLMKESAIREQMKKEMMEVPCTYNCSYQNAGGFEGIMILSSPATPQAEGMRLSEYAKKVGKDEFDVFFELMIANDCSIKCALFCMDEKELDDIFRNPNTVVGTDGLNGSNEGTTHPRAYGSFVRAICHFSKKKKIVSFEEAVRKETSLTAERWGLKSKGVIANGMDADLVLIDYDRLEDKPDFVHPRTLCEGIEKVFVNGELAYEKKKITGAYAGRVVIRSNQ